jgi:hypothetical protein
MHSLARKAAITLFVLVASLMALMHLTKQMDVVVSHYTTRAEAEEDNLLGRGWLPSIIPQSVRNIHVSNDLDVNISEGSFEFEPKDSEAFQAQLKKLEGSSSNTFTYREKDTVWMFEVKAGDGYCQYRMTLQPKAAE